jgi:hypothetical protein
LINADRNPKERRNKMSYQTNAKAAEECIKLDSAYHPFCPLIRDYCKSSCVCHRPAKVKKYTPLDEEDAPHYNVYPPFCDNSMFTGETYSQTD